MRCSLGTRSASKAVLAGRYISPVKPASQVKATMAPNCCAWERQSMAAATENIDSTMVLRRPSVSAKYPPTTAAMSKPTP